MGIDNILFPQTCIGCGRLGTQVCSSCSNKIRVIHKDWCLFCGNTIRHQTTTCTHCVGRHETIPIIGFWYYEHIISRAIWSIKYKQNKRLICDLYIYIDPLSLAKIFLIKERHNNTVLLPVPLHPNRERERGYNQSSYIAKLLSAITNIPILDNVIERVVETPPQAKYKTKIERQQNIRGAFRVKEPFKLKGKTVILVDDVVTTGSTILEISREINRHIRSRTLALCLAREEDNEKYHGI